MELKELTEALCAVPGPSGFEERVFRFLENYAAPFADEVKTDALGNFFAVKRCGVTGARTLLLDAHIDEIGLVITGAKDGFLRFAALGGVDARVLPAAQVRILAQEPIFGVIDVIPPHILADGEEDKTIPLDKLYIDAGLSQAEAERLCPPGTPAVLEGGFSELAGGHVLCRALDDRACAAVVMKAFEELCRRPLDHDIVLMLSTQEEVGSRGAAVGAYGVSPDRAIVVDVTFAKAPDAADVDIELGKGPAVGVGPNMDRAMTRAVFETAKRAGIPVQTEVLPGGSGTNAEVIQISRAGVATALISLPERYMHTPSELVSLADMESLERLIVAFAAEGEGGFAV